jgi:hypothetical protein
MQQIHQIELRRYPPLQLEERFLRIDDIEGLLFRA